MGIISYHENYRKIQRQSHISHLPQKYLYVTPTHKNTSHSKVDVNALKGSALGKAVTYAQNQKPYMENYLSNGRCSLSNNAAENATLIIFDSYVIEHLPKKSI